jgi:hypothetical protein
MKTRSPLLQHEELSALFGGSPHLSQLYPSLRFSRPRLRPLIRTLTRFPRVRDGG